MKPYGMRKHPGSKVHGHQCGTCAPMPKSLTTRARMSARRAILNWVRAAGCSDCGYEDGGACDCVWTEEQLEWLELARAA